MKYMFSMTLVLTLLAVNPALARGGRYVDKIDVVTQNQYLGADLTPIIAAGTPDEFNVAVIEALRQIAANNYPARVKKLSKLIARRLPELVGLQEMFEITCEPFEPLLSPTPGSGCADPSISKAFNDHLEATLSELAELNATYVDVASVQNLNITVPVYLYDGESPDILVTLVDRDVILARDDVAASVTPVPYSDLCVRPSADDGPGCNYQVVASTETPLGEEVIIERGLVGVDAVVDGDVYRFVNTHLEVKNLIPAPPGTPPGVIPGGSIQAAQATELNELVAASLVLLPNLIGAPSPIIVGDINSGPTDEIFTDPLFPDPDQQLYPPYMQLANGADLLGTSPIGLGPLTDAWDLRPGNQPGFTCCQLEDLSNRKSILNERIDVIFSADSPHRVRKARVLGARVWNKTWPPRHGLWPSDHGSVAAELQFK